jgi:hypothetical protein
MVLQRRRFTDDPCSSLVRSGCRSGPTGCPCRLRRVGLRPRWRDWSHPWPFDSVPGSGLLRLSGRPSSGQGVLLFAPKGDHHFLFPGVRVTEPRKGDSHALGLLRELHDERIGCCRDLPEMRQAKGRRRSFSRRSFRSDKLIPSQTNRLPGSPQA